MGEYLARVIGNALAHAFGGTVTTQHGHGTHEWWGWPLATALIAGLLSYLAFRRRRSAPLLTLGVAAVAFMGTAIVLFAPNEMNEFAWQRRATAELRQALIDPDSARIKITDYRAGHIGDRIVCGIVNGRARNGAYQGDQMFAVIFAAEHSSALIELEPACPIDGLERCFDITTERRVVLYNSSADIRKMCADGGPRMAP